MQNLHCCPFQSLSCVFFILCFSLLKMKSYEWFLQQYWHHSSDVGTDRSIVLNCQITSVAWLWIRCHVYYSLASEIHFHVKCFSSYRVILVSQFNWNVMLTFIWNTLNFLCCWKFFLLWFQLRSLNYQCSKTAC